MMERNTAEDMGKEMRIVVLALALAILAPSTIMAQDSAGPRVPRQIYNCCMKPLALGTPAECKKMTGLDCQNMGGKIVTDCKKCK